MSAISEHTPPQRLDGLLDCICDAPTDGDDKVSVRSVMRKIGRRSFGPILLVAGLLIMTPIIGGIPGVPTLLATLVALTAVQIPFRKHHIWLPGWMLDRRISQDKRDKAVEWAKPVARFLDRWSRPRLRFLVSDVGVYFIAACCVAIAIATPFMELVPFSAALAGAAIAAFGLALMVNDGLVALLALGFTGGTAWVLIAAALGSS